MAFKNTWDALFEKLYLGVLIPKWSEHRGYFGVFYKIKEVKKGRELIVIGVSTGPSQDRSISKKHFRIVYDKWIGYRKGDIPATQILPKNSNFLYIVSILKWLEGEISVTALP